MSWCHHSGEGVVLKHMVVALACLGKRAAAETAAVETLQWNKSGEEAGFDLDTVVVPWVVVVVPALEAGIHMLSEEVVVAVTWVLSPSEALASGPAYS